MEKLILDAEAIRELAFQKRWETKTEIAAALGITPCTLSHLLQGKRSPSGKVLGRLAAFKNVQIPFCKMEAR